MDHVQTHGNCANCVIRARIGQSFKRIKAPFNFNLSLFTADAIIAIAENLDAHAVILVGQRVEAGKKFIQSAHLQNKLSFSYNLTCKTKSSAVRCDAKFVKPQMSAKRMEMFECFWM